MGFPRPRTASLAKALETETAVSLVERHEGHFLAAKERKPRREVRDAEWIDSEQHRRVVLALDEREEHTVLASRPIEQIGEQTQMEVWKTGVLFALKILLVHTRRRRIRCAGRDGGMRLELLRRSIGKEKYQPREAIREDVGTIRDQLQMAAFAVGGGSELIRALPDEDRSYRLAADRCEQMHRSGAKGNAVRVAIEGQVLDANRAAVRTRRTKAAVFSRLLSERCRREQDEKARDPAHGADASTPFSMP